MYTMTAQYFIKFVYVNYKHQGSNSTYLDNTTQHIMYIRQRLGYFCLVSTATKKVS